MLYRPSPGETTPDQLAIALSPHCKPLAGADADHDALVERVGDAQFVLLGEATHGTHEFYATRASITRRLVEEKGFTAVAIEGDWPDAYRVNRFVRGLSIDSPENALDGFTRFPSWMWRNEEVLDLVGFLRQWNQGQHDPQQHVGFYGLDLYSMHASIERVIDYLAKHDPPAAARARERYGCFSPFGENGQHYGMLATHDPTHSCEEAVVAQLSDMNRRADMGGSEELFSAVQNARLVRDAEAYYRSMFHDDNLSWNLRDRHMAETLVAIAGGLSGRERRKVVVWAHNSHVGDARATQMGWQGQLTLGQLIRDMAPGNCVLVGFSTHHGTVVAADNWDSPALRKQIVPGLPGSFEDVFHQTGLPSFWLDMRDEQVASILYQPRLQRAIGVVYLPKTERTSHYFHAKLPLEFDWVIHLDDTQALRPLDVGEPWHRNLEEAPETYPSGL